MRIGCDIIEISRIRHFVEQHATQLIGRVFTQQEWDYCQQKANPYPSFAVCFAAKEAVAKAFGTGIGEQLNWTSIEITHNSTGEPEVILDSKGQQLLKSFLAKTIRVSLSHSRDNALAMAVIE